jgi:rhodanese-related sulfurtransferase
VTFADLQEDVSPQRAAQLLREGAVQLVDVREPYEHEAGHIAGGRHVELTRLSEEAGSFDRERPVLFYCRVGSRSAMASQAFRAAGFDAYNLQGGLQAWAGAGLPLEPEDGTVADHKL